jgi:Transglycosylase SLT domain
VRWVGLKLAAAPLALRTAAIAATVLAVFFAANFVYHVVRKPTEMFFRVSGALNKMPLETWRQYAPLFREYSTAAITPELLAALAQVESAGNPMASTYWRWRLTWDPFAIYQPASSSVGMYQMTDPTFAETRRYCIRHHIVVDDGCSLNELYTRVASSRAVELTSVYLDRNVTQIVAHRRPAATPQQKQELAAIIHLCGAGSARVFARRGFSLTAGERCGDHDVAAYLAQFNAMKREFQRFAADERKGIR